MEKPAYEEWVRSRGGTCVIRKILVANNGLGAAKAIRSLRRWAFLTFRRHDILHIISMATPEDIAANAEYIRLADEFVRVAGGSNRNNYNNVELIVKVARRVEAEAVWPGWGHASENPKLPATLSQHGIIFLGPAAESMEAVGDKICANLLAQSCDVNVIPWSGSGLTVPGTTIPPDVLHKATLHSVQDALDCVKRVGYPCMIKASEGGGGKGIRKVSNDEEMTTGFSQVAAEVPGSPIFIQKLSTDSRHLEVQVVADMHGNAISLYGRDCSVQRRHQKIIEEGPMSVAPGAMQRELERGAVRLAKKVSYRSAGTVEYLYNMVTGEYSFLEVNPRLQVEHPVTEMITGVNIPAVQLQVAMGIPLYRIADIRAFFGQDPDGLTPIDFDNIDPQPPRNHTIAARITAEDPDSGFKPTSGAIHELCFRSVPGVVGNFSVGVTNSGVHQFADSQFGHVFASAPTRDGAAALLVQTLNEMSVRGEIHTNLKYLTKLIEKPQFLADKHDTAWLDGLIAKRDAVLPPSAELVVVCGAVVVSDERHRKLEGEVISSLERGVAPETAAINLSDHQFEIIYNDSKYKISVSMGGPDQFYVKVNGTVCEAEVVKMPDGGLIVLLDGKTHTVYQEPSKVGMAIHLDGYPCFFPEDFDPTKLTAPSTGKLLGFLVPDGGHVTEGKPYAEMEAMKMVMPLVAASTGKLTHSMVAGTALETGDCICTVELDDPTSVKKAEVFNGSFPAWKPRCLPVGMPEDNKYRKFHFTTSGVRKLLAGYSALGDPLAELVETLGSPQLVVDDFAEQLAAVSGRAPPAAADELHVLMDSLTIVCGKVKETPRRRSLAHVDDVSMGAKTVSSFLDKYGAADYPELVEFVDRFEQGLYAFECRVLSSFIELYNDVEEVFAQEARLEDALLSLRDQNKDDMSKVVAYAHSHCKLEAKNKLLLSILDEVDRCGMAEYERCHDELARLVVLQGPAYSGVAQRAKEIIIKKQEATRHTQRKWRQLNSMGKGGGASDDGANDSSGEGHPPGSPGRSLAPMGAIERRRGSVGASGYASPPLDSADDESEEERGRIASRLRGRRGSDSLVHSLVDFSQNGHNGKQVFTWESLFDTENPQTRMAAIKAYYASYGIYDAVCINYPPSGLVKVEVRTLCQFLVNSMEVLEELIGYLETSSHTVLSFLIREPSLSSKPKEEVMTSMQEFVDRESANGRFAPELTRIWFSLLCGCSPIHFLFVREGDGQWHEVEVCRDVQPILAMHWEIDRMRTFDLRQLSVSEPRRPAEQDNPGTILSKPDYRIGVFLAEEKAFKSPSARDRRVFLRTVVYNKDIFLPTQEETATQAKPMRTLSGFFARKDTQTVLADQAKKVESVYRPTNNRRKVRHQKTLDDDSVLADVLGNLELAVGKQKTVWNYIFINMQGSGPEDVDAAEEAVQAFLVQCAADLRRLKVAWLEVKVGNGRLVAYNPTGYHFKTEFHLDAKPKLPYPVLNRIQRKRMVAQRLNSTYCYDFIEFFRYLAMVEWTGFVRSLGAKAVGAEGERDAWASVELVLNSEGELEPIDRPVGQNDTGMVCWRCTQRCGSYPEGRDFILVANDITHLSGSFSPDEDHVYCQAFKLAIAEKIPCIYISANSGARIGVDDNVKACFKVAWVDEDDPAKGFHYIYLEDKDYQHLLKHGNVLAERVEDKGEVRWQLKDIVGGVGVECLQGSGMIASITSLAYKETFTLTYVTARSVGIGAYCSRLGHRVIQHAEAPLILTGSSALNKLLGREVYTSNNQIGGPRVMGHNGVSHQIVPDDVNGVVSILNWLSYVPKVKGGPLPLHRLRPHETVDRPPSFMPPRGPHDPRDMVRGFFDYGGFLECMADWGKTVVTGRATLGGLPMGVVAVETRLTEKVIPADPGFAGSQQQVEQQAGQVWFPDSAFKTAQAISDFNREGLPLMIFANWRGFAGGLRDMFGEVLKYGSYIVDALREYNQPVFVYVPYEGELRGGAWVVIDATINPNHMEFYASEASRGGVLEPEGIVDIKFRRDDLVKTMRRTCPNLLSGLDAEATAKREKDLMPVFKQLAVHFASLHDTPGVMLEKKCITSVVPWAQSRTFFHGLLRRRLAEDRLRKRAAGVHPLLSKQELDVVVADLGECVEAAVKATGERITMEAPEVSTYMTKLRRQYLAAAVEKLAAEDLEAVAKAVQQAGR